jgi:hypothetical protein
MIISNYYIYIIYIYTYIYMMKLYIYSYCGGFLEWGIPKTLRFPDPNGLILEYMGVPPFTEPPRYLNCHYL